MNVYQYQTESTLQHSQVDHRRVKLVRTQMSRAHIASCAKRDPTVQKQENTASNVQDTHSQTRKELLASLLISSLIRPTTCTI